MPVGIDRHNTTDLVQPIDLIDAERPTDRADILDELHLVARTDEVVLSGGLFGCLLAFPINGFSTASGQTPSFSEVAFAFQITPNILAWGLVFATIMGFFGGLLPAFRGARLPITAALREA